MQTNIPNPYELIDLRLKNIETLLFQLSSNIENKAQPMAPTSEPPTKFGDLNWFLHVHPKRPARATIYSQISKHQIPSDLIHKPKGNKTLLFYKDKVLQWIENGMLNQAEQVANEYMDKTKGGDHA